jgi:hypothetical protein
MVALRYCCAIAFLEVSECHPSRIGETRHNIMKTKCLKLFREIIIIYFKNHKKHLNDQYRQNAKLFNVEAACHPLTTMLQRLTSKGFITTLTRDWGLCIICSLEWGFVTPSPNPWIGGSPLATGCSSLLIQHIHSYTPNLEAVISNNNLRTQYHVKTRDSFQGLTRSMILYVVTSDTSNNSMRNEQYSNSYPVLYFIKTHTSTFKLRFVFKIKIFNALADVQVCFDF